MVSFSGYCAAVAAEGEVKMKILIVDDQVSVVEGLLKGIHWVELGIEKVYTALNALEAKNILMNEMIDIILCDIEMPVESGLQLYEWMNKKGFSNYCIFLTSHAEFEYAQEAVKLGAFDYILQPASYEEIFQTIQKAVKVIHVKVYKDKLYNKGKVFRQQEKSIAGNAIRNWLSSSGNKKDMLTLAELEVLPCLSEPGYLVLIHIVKWSTLSEKWENTLLEISLENIVSEIFAPNNQLTGLAFIEENTFAMLLQGRDKEEIVRESLIRQLQYLNSVCEQYFRCSIACYFNGPFPLENSLEIWPGLIAHRDNNVLLKGGVFPMGSIEQKSNHMFRIPQIKHWHELMKEGFANTVEQQALGLLDEMCENGTINRITLRYFYQDFMQMLYNSMDGNQRMLNDMFGTTEGLKLYKNGMNSAPQMKMLISYVTKHFHVNDNQEDPKALVRRVIEYIDQNLEDDIRRDELAAHIHLNPDYLSRIFKKETGMNIKEYITEQKMRAARGFLRTTGLPVSYIAAKMGYCNFSHFSFTYKKVMGRTPQEERFETFEKVN